MQHHTPLITTLVAGLLLAFVLGALANRLRLSPLVGYLLAGVVVGPHTPGFVADQGLATELAEIGVILLMFGVGLHFSLKDLLSVRMIAVPGALLQMMLSTMLGVGLCWTMGWPLVSGLVFGLALSVASTVVLLRALQERHLLDSERGRIAAGWLIVQDLAMVSVLVLLPAVAGLLARSGSGTSAGALGAQEIATTLAITLGKAAAFVALMLVIGRRIIPWVLHYVAHTGSRELFRLAVLAIALGVAYGAAALFDVSFALGAFFAGMVLSESELSQQAAAETLPLRDAFAVLFFVSVGMLFDPSILLRDPWHVLATLAIIVAGNSGIGLGILRLFRYPPQTALTIGAGLAQIGEFSFILASLGVSLGLLPEAGRDLILVGAIVSILANPALFAAVDRYRAQETRRAADATASQAPPTARELPVTTLRDHAVVVGFGRVGSRVVDAMRRTGQPLLVFEEKEHLTEQLRSSGIEVIAGNAAAPECIAAANLAGARTLFVAVPNAFEAGQIVEQARAISGTLPIIARAHTDAEVDHLQNLGATVTIMGEREIADAMVAYALKADTAGDSRPALDPAAPISVDAARA